MNKKRIPINKGNYSMDTAERDLEFNKNLSAGWEQEYNEYRKKWIDNALSIHFFRYSLYSCSQPADKFLLNSKSLSAVSIE